MGQRAKLVKDRSKVKGVAIKRKETQNVPDVKKTIIKGTATKKNKKNN